MKKNGFTLVETLISLFILSIAITGAFAVISFNLNSATAIKNSFIASGLAQEGLELMRNLRDTDWFNNREFGSFGNSAGALPDGTYCVQWNSLAIGGPCVSSALRKTGYGFYYHGGGGETIFSRTVSIEKVAASPVNEIIVRVRVFWSEKNLIKEINAEEHLYNWF